MDKTKILDDLESMKCGMVEDKHFGPAKLVSDTMKFIRAEDIKEEAMESHSENIVEDVVKRTITKEEFFQEYAIQSIEKRNFLRTIIELRRELQEVKKLSDKL